jgi:hypothetical protein
MAWGGEEEEDRADVGVLGVRGVRVEGGLIHEGALENQRGEGGERAELHGVGVGAQYLNLASNFKINININNTFNMKTTIPHSHPTRSSSTAWACTSRPSLLLLHSCSEAFMTRCPT